jgi:CubicO group peptidase (beta-lactamase class C family)
MSIVLLGLFAGSCQHHPQVPYPAADAQGIDGVALAEIVAAARSIDGMKWLLLARNGALVAEEYFNGQGPDSTHDVRSVTKSVNSALIGIAIREGYIGSVQETLADYFDGVTDTLDPELGATSIEDLLTMRAGHDWHEIPGPSEFPDWVSAPDQIRYILDKPLVHAPGEHFNYSDGSAHLISVILSEATGTSALEFAEQYLFASLGIGSRRWLVDNRGHSYGGVALYLTARDMLSFGALYLDGGSAGGQQILPADWVATSTSTHVDTDNAIPYGSGYAYYWWTGQSRGRDFYFANGYGGQFIFVVPAANLVVVAACEWHHMGDAAPTHWYEIITLIVEELLPIVR